MNREAQERMRVDWPTRRTIDALEGIALRLEELVLLKEHELGVRVEYEDGNPYVQVLEPDEK